MELMPVVRRVVDERGRGALVWDLGDDDYEGKPSGLLSSEGVTELRYRQREIPEPVTAKTLTTNGRPKMARTVSLRGRDEDTLALASNLDCSICQGKLGRNADLLQGPCGHMHHLMCIKEWTRTKRGTCPVCRTKLLHECYFE